MNNVTYLSAHPAQSPAAATQPPTTITLQQALATGRTPGSLRACADWNERRSYNERNRKARTRHKAQAAALREVADELQYGRPEQVREAA